MKYIYVVMYESGACIPKISQEGYTNLEKAQAFIESRNSSIKKVTEYLYKSDDLSERYSIHPIQIK